MSEYEIGQSSLIPSFVPPLKSSGPKRSEIRPQWLVRPPSIRARHQRNFDPDATVYGSSSMSHPPSHASNSPNGFLVLDAPRRGDAYAGTSIFEFFEAYHSAPASSITTFAPAFVSAYADIPPPAPEPTMHTSYSLDRDLTCTQASVG